MGIEILEPFVGAWRAEANFARVPDAPPSVGGNTTFEWSLDNRFLVQRAEVDHPDAPSVLAIFALADHGFTQHYFDSRGVVRIYSMTFDGTTWTLSRDSADFSALHFAQRFTGTFADDGRRIEGEWQIREDGEDWKHDFDLTYTKLT